MGEPFQQRIDEWLSAHGQDKFTDPVSIEAILSALLELSDATSKVYQRLALHPARHGDAAGLLEHLSAERLRLLTQLGALVFRRRLAGGDVVLIAPTASKETAAAACAPLAPIPSSQSTDTSAPSTVSSSAPGTPIVAVSPLETPTRLSPARSIGSTSPSATSWATDTDGLLHELMDLVGPLRDLHEDDELRDEVDALERVTAPEILERWPLLPRPAQRNLLAMVVARARALRELRLLPRTVERVRTILQRLPVYARAHEPGYVNGLQGAHRPEGISWLADATEFWGRLKTALGRDLGGVLSRR